VVAVLVLHFYWAPSAQLERFGNFFAYTLVFEKQPRVLPLAVYAPLVGK
jgi:hypothetical protein